jgi:toxin ParE1/3/4
MRIRWSPGAANDLERIRNYLAEYQPLFCRPTVRKLYDAARSLKQFPNRGRLSRETGARELIIAPLPYIIVNRVLQHAVEIIRIVHTSQDWPRK